MLTIFSMPKAFRGHIRTIQRNAIQSWATLRPKPEIIVFGKDEGTRETAAEFGLRYMPDVAVNEHGTPLLNDLFQKAEGAASADWMCYVNADILLLSDFTEAVRRTAENLKRFLLVSKRINLEVREPISFETGWEKSIRRLAESSGIPGDHTAIDVFVFSKGLYPVIPDFGLGRLWFDQWLIKAALQRGSPVVDLSRVAPVIHQNHDYNHVPGGAQQVWRGHEAEHNFRLYGGRQHAFTLLDVTHELTPAGRIRPVLLRRWKFEMRRYAWEIFVRRTVNLRDSLGLRRKFWRAENQPRSGG
jgi:hypothetical protein